MSLADKCKILIKEEVQKLIDNKETFVAKDIHILLNTSGLPYLFEEWVIEVVRSLYFEGFMKNYTYKNGWYIPNE